MNKCPKCGLWVEWKDDPLREGVNCFNVKDGKYHWDTCSETRTKYAIKHGDKFEEKDDPRNHGYIVEDKTKPLGEKRMYMQEVSIMHVIILFVTNKL